MLAHAPVVAAAVFGLELEPVPEIGPVELVVELEEAAAANFDVELNNFVAAEAVAAVHHSLPMRSAAAVAEPSLVHIVAAPVHRERGCVLWALEWPHLSERRHSLRWKMISLQPNCDYAPNIVQANEAMYFMT